MTMRRFRDRSPVRAPRRRSNDDRSFKNSSHSNSRSNNHDPNQINDANNGNSRSNSHSNNRNLIDVLSLKREGNDDGERATRNGNNINNNDNHHKKNDIKNNGNHHTKNNVTDEYKNKNDKDINASRRSAKRKRTRRQNGRYDDDGESPSRSTSRSRTRTRSRSRTRSSTSSSSGSKSATEAKLAALATMPASSRHLKATGSTAASTSKALTLFHAPAAGYRRASDEDADDRRMRTTSRSGAAAKRAGGLTPAFNNGNVDARAIIEARRHPRRQNEADVEEEVIADYSYPQHVREMQMVRRIKENGVVDTLRESSFVVQRRNKVKGDADDADRYSRYLQQTKTMTSDDFGGCQCKRKGVQIWIRLCGCGCKCVRCKAVVRYKKPEIDPFD